MSAAVMHPDGSTGADRFEQARVWRRRWAQDAALLGSIGAIAATDGLALGSLPPWLALPQAERVGFAVLTGAVLRSRRLRRTVDGSVLAAVSAVIGEDRLDGVIALPRRLAEPPPLRWSADPVAQLHALGGEVLVRAFDGPETVRQRLAGWFPPSDRLARADRRALQRIGTDAWMLWEGHPPVRSPEASR